MPFVLPEQARGKPPRLVGLIEQKLAAIPAEEMLVLMFNRDIRTDFQDQAAGYRYSGAGACPYLSQFLFEIPQPNWVYS